MIPAMIVSLRHFLGWLVSVFRSREDLVLENLALRRQLLALHAQQPRRRLTALQTLIWYPSLRSTARPMTVGDYTQLADTDIHCDAPNPDQNGCRSLLKPPAEIPWREVRDA